MDTWKLIPADEARRLLLETPPVRGTEHVPLRQAAGRVLAEALRAPHDMPPERRSAMDGYAGRAEDFAAAVSGDGLRVIGAVAAGSPFAGALAAGQVVSIATGAVVPAGADAVVMVEATAAADGSTGQGERRYVSPGGQVRITKAVPRGAHLVEPGEDVKAGATVLEAGRRLGARDLSALAAFGVVDVAVMRRPRIATLATGSEVCAVTETPRPGQVRDSNQYVLAAEIEAAGGVAVLGGIVPDDYEALREAVSRLCAAHDGVILSGGSSVGPKDLTGRVLADVGTIVFHGIDIRPGKPTVLARVGDKPVIGMPGYPTSSMVVFEAFIRPLLAHLGGESPADAWPVPARARLAAPYAKPASREDYLRVRLERRDGDVWAVVVPGGSAAISNVLQADGLACIPTGVERLEAGTVTDFRRFL